MDPCSEINLARKKKSNMMKTQIGLHTRMCNGEESYSDVTEYIIYIVKDLSNRCRVCLYLCVIVEYDNWYLLYRNLTSSNGGKS